MVASCAVSLAMLDMESYDRWSPTLHANDQSGTMHNRMAERDLPQAVVHRPKKGFQVPFGAWARGSWRAWVEERFWTGWRVCCNAGGWNNCGVSILRVSPTEAGRCSRY